MTLYAALSALLLATTPAAGADTAWLASWSASPQAVWSNDFILPANVPARLHDQTVRQVARVSVGGQRLRIVLSNAHGATPLTIGAATLALALEGSAIVPGSLRAMTFGGHSGATIAPGAPLLSDPVTLAVTRPGAPGGQHPCAAGHGDHHLSLGRPRDGLDRARTADGRKQP